MNTIKRRPIFHCLDCGINTKYSEYYMVHNEIWLSSGLGLDDGMLCISCLEKRIGRKLNKNDFTDCLLNHMPDMRSKRLSDRLTAK